MWKDSETNIDYLNIGHIVNMLNNLILDDNLTPAIIGVYGAWGSGKSSVLKMSEELLNKDKDILCRYQRKIQLYIQAYVTAS